jgi:hypothetical protein
MMGFGCVLCNWVFLGLCEMYVGCGWGLKLVLHWVELLKKLVEFKAPASYWFLQNFPMDIGCNYFIPFSGLSHVGLQFISKELQLLHWFL